MIKTWGAALLAFAMVQAVPTHAVAHMATPTSAQPLGWEYPYDCCSDKDCQPIPVTAITETGTRVIVRLRKSEHKMLTKDVTFELTHTDPRIRPSLDGEWHACISPMTFYDRTPEGNNLICLLAPPKGF